MVDDARNRTKTWLDTYLDTGNILKNDELNECSIHVHYDNPPYSLRRVFYDDKDIDITFSIGQPKTVPSAYDWDGTLIGYLEKVPVIINTVDKNDVTGLLILEKAEAEIRRIFETYPLGSYRGYSRSEPGNKDMGGWRMYGITYVVSYDRDTT